MKKLLATILSLTMVLSLASCAGSTDSSSKADTTEVSSTAATSSETTESEDTVSSVTDSLELLNTVWDSYGEDEKFAVAGGDTANMNSEGAGKYDISDAAALDSALAFPAAEVGKIDGAASIVHMMNANTFTGGAFHCVNADDVSAVAEAIKTNISTRQWLCGFPEKLLIVTVDDYVVSAFGATDLVDTFKTKLTSAYSSAQIVTDEVME